MADGFLYAAGIGAMFVAMIHGWLGATKVVGPAQTPHPSSKRILHALMFLSAVYWFVAGLALFLTPSRFEDPVRTGVVYVCAAMLFSGALGNIWGMRGKHFGGYLLLVISALAMAGA